MVPGNATDVEAASSGRQLLEEQRAWELRDLDREPDRLQVLLDDLRLSHVRWARRCLENGFPGSRVALRKRARRAKVGTVERVVRSSR